MLFGRRKLGGDHVTINSKEAVMTNKEDHPLRSLFTDLVRELSALMRQEVQLAKTEMSEKASQAGYGIAYIAVGGALAYIGLLLLCLALVIALANVVPPWLSALIIGAFVIIVGMAILQKGRSNLKAQRLVPEQTVETLREDKEFVQEHV